ncbi:MAG: hypothetical protein GC191_07150 [Azospirillum sp.]|nr:hypothetical protein [Azospirillum sp.]
MSISTAVRQAEDVQIFNQICGERAGVTVPDWTRLRQLEWRLMRMVRQQPENFVVRTSLAAAQVMLGQREQAQQNLEIAYGLRERHLVPVQCALCLTFAVIGNFEKAMVLVRELIVNPELLCIHPVVNICSHVAFLAGDAGLLIEMSDLARNTGQINVAGLILAGLGNDLVPHLSAHQQIVQSILQPHPCSVDVGFIDDGYEPPLISTHWPVSCLSAQHRRDLEWRLADALYDYYANTPISPGRGVNAFGFQLLDIPKETTARTAE